RGQRDTCQRTHGGVGRSNVESPSVAIPAMQHADVVRRQAAHELLRIRVQHDAILAPVRRWRAPGDAKGFTGGVERVAGYVADAERTQGATQGAHDSGAVDAGAKYRERREVGVPLASAEP